MKKTLSLYAAIITLSVFACKAKPEAETKTPEQQKAETIVKSDKEKADSVLEYYKKKAGAAPDSLSTK
jgi:hypothetical protein